MLTRLKITHFLSCVDTEVDTASNVVALVGRNGVGKTNVLKAIEWLAKNATKSARGRASSSSLRSQGRRFEAELRLGSTLYVLTFGVGVRRLDVETRQPVLEEQLTVSGEDGAQSIYSRSGDSIYLGSGEVLKTSYQSPALSALISILHADHPSIAHVTSVYSFLKGIRFYNLESEILDNTPIAESDYADWIAEAKTTGSSSPSVLLRLLHAHKTDRELFDEIRDILGERGLGLVDRIDVRELASAHPSPQPEDRSPTLEPIYFVYFTPSSSLGGAGKKLLFSNLSHGTQRVIRLVVSLLFDHRSVMLIDQPDDSIHAALLHKLVGLFRSYSHQSQLIITAHTPGLLDALTPSEVRIVYAINGITKTRSLSEQELIAAQNFLNRSGPLSEFFAGID